MAQHALARRPLPYRVHHEGVHRTAHAAAGGGREAATRRSRCRLSAGLLAHPGKQITIRQLLTHTSGLPDINSFPDFFAQVQAGLLTDEQILDRVSRYTLLSAPGARFSYSNDGYVLLGAIIAATAGSSYEDAMRARILEPASMSSTMLNHQNQVVPTRASGYRRTLGGFENVIPYVADAAAGLLSTVDDMLRWDEALNGTSIASPASKELMWRISPNGNAYGWLVSQRPAPGAPGDSIRVIKGDGAIPGFYALTLRVPSRHVVTAWGTLSTLRGSETRQSPVTGARSSSIPRRPTPKASSPSLLRHLGTRVCRRGRCSTRAAPQGAVRRTRHAGGARRARFRRRPGRSRGTNRRAPRQAG